MLIYFRKNIKNSTNKCYLFKFKKDKIMDKNKLYKIVVLGFISINFPMFLGLGLVFIISEMERLLDNLILLSVLCFFYWCYISSWYRYYSIFKIKTKEEYFFWKALSINALLLWPDNFILTKLEYWNDEKFEIYKARKKELGFK